jgi:hypothetical protein
MNRFFVFSLLRYLKREWSCGVVDNYISGGEYYKRGEYDGCSRDH